MHERLALLSEAHGANAPPEAHEPHRLMGQMHELSSGGVTDYACMTGGGTIYDVI